MIVAGNWKMYEGPDPAALADRLASIDGVEAIVCPPDVSLARCVDAGLTIAGVEIGKTRDLTRPVDLVRENFPYLGSR